MTRKQVFIRVTMFLLIAGLLVGGLLFTMILIAASYTSPYAISIAPWLLFFVLVMGIMMFAALLMLSAPKLFKGLKLGGR
jgi:hypothetical protein